MQFPVGAIPRSICAALLAAMCWSGSGSAAQAEQSPDLIRVQTSTEAFSANPIVAETTQALHFFDHLFLPLVDYSLGEGFVPVLAESWSYNEDASVYTFVIREGLRWSDGTPLGAAEIAESYQYIGAIEGSDLARTFPDIHVTALEENGRDMVQIDLGQPTPLFISQFTDSPYAVFPVHLRDEIDFSKKWSSNELPENMAYSGPYVLEAASEEAWVLKPNPHYTLGRVENEGIYYKWLKDDDSRAAVSAMLSGQTDVVIAPAPARYAFVNQLDGIVMETASTNNGIQFYYLNVKQPPLDDREIRRAVTYAMAKELPSGLLSESYLDPNRSLLAASMHSSYDPVRPYWLDEDPDALVETAREIMRERGYSAQNRLSLDIHVDKATTHERVAAAMARRLALIYVDAKVVATPWEDHFVRVFETHDFAIGRMGWGYGTPHPIDFLVSFYSDHQYNGGQFSNAEFDRTLDQMRATADPEETNRLSQIAHQLIIDDYAAIPMHARAYGILRHDNISIGAMTVQDLPRLTELRWVTASDGS